LEKNLSSILNQEYKNFRVIIIDDNSNDGTGEAIQEYITNNNITNIKLYRNKTRNLQLSNTYRAVQSCKSDEIIVILDGDDWLAHNKVLNRLNEEYEKGAWLTYGQYITHPYGKIGHCQQLNEGIPARKQDWVTSHLRTFYAGLFKRIKLEDLLYKGKFFPCCADFAAMLPMAEMAQNKAVFIPDILYTYNRNNPLHVDSHLKSTRIFLCSFIPSKNFYPPYRGNLFKEKDRAPFKIWNFADPSLSTIDEAINILKQAKLEILIIGNDQTIKNRGSIISPLDSTRKYFAISSNKVKLQENDTYITKKNHLTYLSATIKQKSLDDLQKIFALNNKLVLYTIRPKKSKFDCKTDMLIFSFNRPMQLYALLESTNKYVDGISNVYIIYRADKKFEKAYQQVKVSFPNYTFYKQGNNPHQDFKPLVLKILNQNAPHIVFAVDDIIVKDTVKIDECVKKLNEENAFGFYLRFGKNICRNYMRQIPAPLPPGKNITPKIYKWELSNSQGGWEYARTVDMTIYRKADILKEICPIKFRSPNELEGRWHRERKPNLSALCYNTSKIVNIPANLVNEYSRSNRNAQFYTADQLLTKFNQGLKIDIKPFHQINNTAPHQEYKYSFIKR